MFIKYVCVVFLMGVLSATYAQPISTSAFNVSEAVIVKAATVEEKSGLNEAAKELSGIIAEVTGRDIPIYEEGKEPTHVPAFYLGETRAARNAGIDGALLRNGDWRMKGLKGKVFLFGKTAYAVNAAVYDFAERYFDYFLFTPDCKAVFTRRNDIIVPVCDVTVKPAIYVRDIYHAMFNSRKYPTTKKLWERWTKAHAACLPHSVEGKYRVSYQTKSTCHTSFAYLPPEKWFKDHPEYYSMTPDGKRRGVRNSQSQLCYTNPDTYQHVLAALLKFIAADRVKYPENPPLVYDFTQQDNSDFLCLCPSCKKVIAKYNRVEGGHKEGGDAGLQLEFVNRLARDVRTQYPDVQIRTFAYVSTERAPNPGSIQIEPNVRIWWCDVYSKSDHTIPLCTPGHYNEHQKKELEEWFSFTPNIEIWDYMLYHNRGLEVTADAVKSDAEFFAKFNVPCLFMECERSRGVPAFYDLNFYLMAKLYVDPKRDVEKLIRSFCRSYGAGSNEMFAAVQFLRGEIAVRPAPTSGDWHARNIPWLQDCATIEKFEAVVKKAYDNVQNDPVARSRIVPVLATTWRNLMGEYKKRPQEKKKYVEAQKQFQIYAKETARTVFMEPAERAKAEENVDKDIDRMTMVFDDLPAELRHVPTDKLLFIDASFRESGERVEDSLSSRKQAVKVKTELPMPCGVYDWPSKESFSFGNKFEEGELVSDKYTWVKMGVCHIGRNTKFWFPGSWRNTFVLSEFYILADGLDIDPNWYDLWASARYEDGAIWIDRLVLKRISPPQK
jgi:hypothetical protein